MVARIKTFLFGLLYENSEPSLTRVLIAASFLVFVGVSLYLCIAGVQWDKYDTFATITGGGSVGGKILEKATAIAKGSPAGQMPGPRNGGA